MKPLSTAKMLIYSTGNAGANLVYAFANFGLPLFLSAYPVNNVVVGLLAQERSLVGGFVQPLVGVLSDRLPPNRLGRRRPFFLVGVPLTALSLLVLSAYPPLWAVLAVMTVLSFFLAVAYDPYMALMPDITPPEQRGRVGGVMAVFNMLGTLLLIGVAFALWQQHQQLVFWLVAGGLVASFGVTFFGITEPRLSEVRRPEPRPSAAVYLRDVLSRREMMKYLACTFFFWLGNGGVTPFVTRFGVEVMGLPENVSFLMVLPAILGTAAFAVPAGLLTERYGKKPVLTVGFFLFGAAALVGAQLVHGIPDGIVLMSIVGVANAITTALIFPLFADMIPPTRIGEFTGISSFVASIAQPLGAVAAGAMVDTTGSMRGAFSAGGVAMLIAFALLLTVRQPVIGGE